MRIVAALLAVWASCAAARAAEPNPNATLIYYDMAGNETLDPAEPQNNSSLSHLLRKMRRMELLQLHLRPITVCLLEFL